MTTADIARQVRGGRRRGIGAFGTAARVVVGTALLGDVVYGHATGGFWLGPWVLGLVGFPGLLLVWQRLRAQRKPDRWQATGVTGHALNVAVFLALWLTPYYLPALSITSDAALIFYGASMLLAAVRSYAGCEVLAVSNWVLRRDDQVGCVLFLPVDQVDRRPKGDPDRA